MSRKSCLWSSALCAALLWITAAAAETPNNTEVRKVLQERLDTGFSDRLFKVRKVSRTASQAHAEQGDDREWLLVGYSAGLRFLADHNLSSWDDLNVGSLIQLLGSRPRDVRGINALGNLRGDVLQVEGTLAFVRDGEAWLPVVSDARIEPDAATSAQAEPTSFRDQLRQRLAELGEAFEAAEYDEREAQLAVDLEQLVADVECRMADRAGQVRLATGAATTEYHALGLGLAERVNREEDTLFVRQTPGSVANIELLHDGLVDAAFVQNDIAHLAYSGLGPFQGKLPMTGMRALCALFPEVVHVVTLERSGIDSLDDLRGATVDVGPDDSGSRFNAAQVLAVAGLTIQDLERVQGKAPGEALDDLVMGRVQAAIMTGAYPYPEIATRVYGLPLKVLSLGEEQVAEVVGDAPFLLPMTVPANTYVNQPEPIRTIGVSALLVAREDLPDDSVEALLATLMDRDGALSQHTVQAYYISTDTAERGLSIPLHPAAYRFLETRRAATPELP